MTRFGRGRRAEEEFQAGSRPLKAATMKDKLVGYALPLDEELAQLVARIARQRRLIDDLHKARLQSAGAQRLLKQLQRQLALLRATKAAQIALAPSGSDVPHRRRARAAARSLRITQRGGSLSELPPADTTFNLVYCAAGLIQIL